MCEETYVTGNFSVPADFFCFFEAAPRTMRFVAAFVPLQEIHEIRAAKQRLKQSAEVACLALRVGKPAALKVYNHLLLRVAWSDTLISFPVAIIRRR